MKLVLFCSLLGIVVVIDVLDNDHYDHYDNCKHLILNEFNFLL